MVPEYRTQEGLQATSWGARATALPRTCFPAVPLTAILSRPWPHSIDQSAFHQNSAPCGWGWLDSHSSASFWTCCPGPPSTLPSPTTSTPLTDPSRSLLGTFVLRAAGSRDQSPLWSGSGTFPVTTRVLGALGLYGLWQELSAHFRPSSNGPVWGWPRSAQRWTCIAACHMQADTKSICRHPFSVHCPHSDKAHFPEGLSPCPCGPPSPERRGRFPGGLSSSLMEESQVAGLYRQKCAGRGILGDLAAFIHARTGYSCFSRRVQTLPLGSKLCFQASVGHGYREATMLVSIPKD